MRTIRDVSLLCQSNARVAATRYIGQRCASSSSPVEPFDLPRLVIDLDAVDSPYVRQLPDEPAPEYRPKLQRPLLPLRAFQPKPKRGAILDRSQATPLDLLQYALLGHEGTSDPRNVFIRSLFKAQNLSLRDPSEYNMKNLTLSLPSKFERTLQGKDFDPEYQRRLRSAMSSHKDYSQLFRMVTSLSNAKEGCLFLLDHEQTLKREIDRWRTQGQGPSTVSIAILLNNIIKSIKSHGLTPRKRLLGLALLYASRTGTLAAVRKHLTYHMQTPGAFDATFIASLYSLAKVYAKNLPMSASLGWSDVKTQRKELLRLITGWEYGDRPATGTPRELSFASMIIPGTLYFYQYIIVLGEMGLSNAIWIEWQALDKDVPPAEATLNARTFAIALILAKDPGLALEILESAAKTVTPAEPDSLQFRIKPYKAITVDSILQRTESLILEHYSFHRLKPTTELRARLRKQLQVLESKPSISSNDAIRILEDLLVVQFPDYIPDYSLYLRWAPIQNYKEGNMRGLVVMPLVGHIPVYQKPAGTRIQVSRR